MPTASTTPPVADAGRPVASTLAGELRAACVGVVAEPGGPGYEAARRPPHAAAGQRPAAVVFPADAADVASVLVTARAAGLRVAVQGTGRASHRLGDLEETVLLRTSALAGVRIDPGARTARVGAGTLWRDVVAAAAVHGLAPVAGSGTGVAGDALGGGVGPLARRYGLACNHVTAIELVTPAGAFVRCTDAHEPELFWALRGGGGAFGVVTALELALEPLGALCAGGLFFPIGRAGEVLAAWRELTRDAPEGLTSTARLLRCPPLPAVPEALRGRAWVAVRLAFTGAPAAGAALAAGLRALGPSLDTVGPAPDALLPALHVEPGGPAAVPAGHALLDALPPAALEAVVELAGAGGSSPPAVVELRHLGGALARAPHGAGALATVDAAYALHTAGPARDGGAAGARGAALRDALAPHGRGRALLELAHGPLTGADLFPPAVAERLAALRAVLDPGGVLHAGLTH